MAVIKSDREGCEKGSVIEDSGDKDEELGHVLVGKLIQSKWTSIEAMTNALRRVWRLYDEVDIKSLGKNIFLLQFKAEKDKRRIIEGSPWSSDKHYHFPRI